MLSVKIITVGSLKEKYLKDAVMEYSKRLSAFCKLDIIELKESRIQDNPSNAEIAAVLESEAEKIREHLSGRAYKIALCVEGKQCSSEALAKKIEDISSRTGEIVLVIGSSHGLSDSIKTACDMRLSVSELTFPHQLMRVLLLEALYRSFNIIKGTKYHK